MPTCEELGFSKEECKNLDPDIKDALGITDAAGGRSRQTPTGAINTTEQLKKIFPEYEKQGLIDVINSLQKRGMHLGSRLYKELQDKLLETEAKTQLPASVLAGTTAPTQEQVDRFNRSGGGTGLSAVEEENIRSQIAERNARLELARQQQAAEEAYRAQQLELQRQQALEERRQNLLSAALRLTEGQMTERQRATEQSVDLAGKDTFRFLGQINQQAVADVQTPFDIFKGKLAQRATAPLPNVGPNSTIEDLESAIGKLNTYQQQSQQPIGGGIGFAQGGQAPMPGPLEARLVGEQGSYIAPGTEVMVTGGGQATIIPLGKGMETGGQTPLSQASLGPLPDLFRNLRNSIFRLNPTGPGDAAQQRSALGFLPEGAPKNPEPTFGGGYGALATPLSLKPGYDDLVRAGVISAPEAERIVNLIGLLPNPRQAAVFLKNLDPAEQEALTSAYRLAGIPEESLKAMLASATITGPTRRAVSFAA